MTPFDFVNSVTYTKVDLTKDDEQAIKQYVPFIVNKALSYHLDAVLEANLMNQNAHLEPRMQYAFFLNSLRKARRFSKWSKPDNSEELSAVAEFFRFSQQKAKQALELLTPAQVKAIQAKLAARGDRNVGARKYG